MLQGDPESFAPNNRLVFDMVEPCQKRRDASNQRSRFRAQLGTGRPLRRRGKGYYRDEGLDVRLILR